MDRKKQNGVVASQHDRFLETAHELGTDDDPEAFEALFNKLVPPIAPETKKEKNDK